MLNNKIAQLRDLINHKIKVDDFDNVELLKMSQELDILILEFYKEYKNNNEDKDNVDWN